MDTKMNKLRITKNGKGWKFQDGHDFVYTSNDLAELREMFWDMVRLGINSIELSACTAAIDSRTRSSRVVAVRTRCTVS